MDNLDREDAPDYGDARSRWEPRMGAVYREPVYTDETLAAIVRGLSEPMRRAIVGDDRWPTKATIDALQARGLLDGTTRTYRGETVAGYLRRKAVRRG